MVPSSISNYLERNHARYSIVRHPVAYTAQEEAAAAHVPGNEWAKSVVCFADGQAILAVVPATCAVDLERLQRAAGVESLRLAREAEFAGLYRDSEPGAMPPLGPLYGQPVFVDERLTADPEIAFNAGSHREAIRMPYGEFERLARPTVAQFASGPSPSVQRNTVAIDPICGARLDAPARAEWSDHKGDRYYFCSLGCKMEFDDNPNGYARNSSR